jgi:bacteriocin-like protein
MKNNLIRISSSLSFENLSQKELESTNGGGIIVFEIFKYISDNWTEIKKGFMDARNFN